MDFPTKVEEKRRNLYQLFSSDLGDPKMVDEWVRAIEDLIDAKIFEAHSQGVKRTIDVTKGGE